MLLFTAASSFWLDFVFKLKVLKSTKRWALSVAPIALFYLTWDAFAISRKEWSFDARKILQIYLPFHIPIEEFLFFIVVPLASILTYEGLLEVLRRIQKRDLQ